MISMRLAGLRMFTPKIKAAVKKPSQKAAVRCALLVEREAKRLLGKKAKRVGKSGYEPSVAPQPPAVRTAALKNSIQTAATKDGAIVGPTERYGKVHEFGGRHHPKRPFMRPALRNAMKKFPKEFKNMPLYGGAI